MPAIDKLLQSISEVMFPDGMGNQPISLESHGYDGDTPLHVFAWRNDVAAAKLLLGAGADPNARGEMDDTPLHVAITQNNVDLVILLLGYGANPDLRSEFGSARELALDSGGAIATLLTGKADKRL
ncbi:ankyrin repeat domain-containing protein [Ottowia testudinis]|uniref:Ankyrin repeat domain-containing protein n=1 Tax=Ottowia testudinis TaxID=2816950 RepID=A0A975H4K2_9BURK|nr:ankyrin repeat domain-containing protein [Ottowia testudinis]QTD46455.1 ankyrin repeat domain-containing protein [Ottowia testudinis]